MTTSRTMVQIADRAWTLQALHHACLLARQSGAEVALISMISVQYWSWLGTAFGAMNFTAAEEAALHDYAATVEDYGVPCSLHVFQYITLAEALAEAADNLEAQFVFATLPHSLIPYWRYFQLRGLRRRLAQEHHQLIDPDSPDLSAQVALPGAIAELHVSTGQD